MANIKSAIKRIDVTATKTAANKAKKTKVATYIKKYKALIENKDLENAEKFLNEVYAVIDSSELYHKNCSSRKKATLARLLDTAKKAN